MSTLNTLQLCVGPLQENCYFLWVEGQGECICFDPGDEADVLQAELKRRKLTVVAFLQTHCHGDHIGALAPMKAAFPSAPLYVPEAELSWLSRPTLNLSYFVGGSVTAPAADFPVREGDEIKAAGLSLKAIHVPGHSPGGTAYYIKPDEGVPHLFCGDILFAGGIGRTDLPGGEGMDLLVEGIREKLFVLPEETAVHPGHGLETSIGEEKRSNPFCGLELP